MRETIQHGKEPPSRDAVEGTVRNLLSPEDDIDFAYLFGSVAKNRGRATSDVDVAVHLRAGSSVADRFERGLDLESRLERALDRAVQATTVRRDRRRDRGDVRRPARLDAALRREARGVTKISGRS